MEPRKTRTVIDGTIFKTGSIDSLVRGEVAFIHDVPSLSLLASLGIRLGKRVRLISKSVANGPLILSIDNRSVALDRELASQITIRKQR